MADVPDLGKTVADVVRLAASVDGEAGEALALVQALGAVHMHEEAVAFAGDEYRAGLAAAEDAQQQDTAAMPPVPPFGAWLAPALREDVLPGRGVAYVAVEDLPAGCLLCRCREFAGVPDCAEGEGGAGEGGAGEGGAGEAMSANDRLLLAMLRRARDSPQAEAYFRHAVLDMWPREEDVEDVANYLPETDRPLLHAVRELDPLRELVSDEDIARLRLIIRNNIFGYGDMWHITAEARRGLFVEAARFNHDCNPSAVWFVDQDACVAVRTIRPVARGEEVCISYVPIYASRSDRADRLAHYLFVCSCDRCHDDEHEAMVDGGVPQALTEPVRQMFLQGRRGMLLGTLGDEDLEKALDLLDVVAKFPPYHVQTANLHVTISSIAFALDKMDIFRKHAQLAVDCNEAVGHTYAFEVIYLLTQLGRHATDQESRLRFLTEATRRCLICYGRGSPLLLDMPSIDTKT